ncbi:leupaxin [Ambystoma mexicanum]|uniref:leupaxin n=1 Tax=Ambystoma mexicanum TaxID=8296 RepID=UPI0037E99A63
MEDLDALLEELEQASLSLGLSDDECPASDLKGGDYDAPPPRHMAEESHSRPEGTNGGEASPQLKSIQALHPASETSDVSIVPPVYITHLTKAREDHVYSEVPEMLPSMSPPKSTAAQKLDDLMSSLFSIQSKIQFDEDPPTVSEPVVLSRTTTLENMLEALEEDLKKMGAAVVPKGSCASCSKPIVGKMITALDQTWHPEHFTCTHCHQEIGTLPFCERNGLPYCQMDHEELFSPRCAYCKAPIINKVLTALDQTWHPEHFFCTHCGEAFEGHGYHEKSGKPYCRKDFLTLFAPKCGGCSQPVIDKYLTAMNSIWHEECFVCGDCFCTFSNGCFYELNGRPFCELDFHRQQGTICKGCQLPIKGRCVNAMGARFHPEHFVCTFCQKQLSHGIFREQNEKPYCHACFSKLFV